MELLVRKLNEDEGIEVVALILDYLKRIRPAEKGANEKEELKNIYLIDVDSMKYILILG